jgi:hypothetical protein
MTFALIFHFPFSTFNFHFKPYIKLYTRIYARVYVGRGRKKVEARGGGCCEVVVQSDERRVGGKSENRKNMEKMQ